MFVVLTSVVWAMTRNAPVCVDVRLVNGNCCSLLVLLGDSRVKPVLLLDVSTVVVLLVVVRLDHVKAAKGSVPPVVVFGEVTVFDNWKAFTCVGE